MARTRVALDPASKEVTICFTEPYSAWQTLFSSAEGIILPQHALEGQRGEAWNTTWADGIVNPETGEPIASGPFIFEQWERGHQLDLVRNYGFAGTPANLDRVVFRFTPDTHTQVQQLRAGEIDVMDPQVQLDLLPQIASMEHVVYQTDAGPIWEHLDFQHTRPPLDRRHVRQAIAMAIDREAFIEQFIRPFHAEAEPLNSIMYVSNQPQYEDHFGDVVPHDPQAAVDLLTDNGCERDADDVFICDGHRLEFDWVSTTGSTRRELFFEFAQQQLREIGVVVHAAFDEPAVVFSDDVMGSGNWELVNFAWIASPDPADNVHLWGCFDDTVHPTGPGESYGAQNRHRYCPEPEVSQLLLDTNRELDPDRRAQMMNEASRVLAQAVPILPLYQLPTFLAWNKDFTGLQANSSHWGQVWNIAEWATAD
jgi:peptide/nickel transport system substrate-binding protein